MMAFFLLMWLINTTTPEQKRGIADYFAPQSIAQTMSGSGGVLGGKVMGEDSAHAGGAQSVMQKQSPPAHSSTQKSLAAGATEGGASSSTDRN
jgi:chemotaxis protein MotB